MTPAPPAGLAGPPPSWPQLLRRPVSAVAPVLVGGTGWSAVLHHGGVSVRLTEVEAYGGADDPGSHAHRGPTPRNATMFGPPGSLYCYRIYGLHVCANLVCHEAGDAAAVLLRAGVVTEGSELARRRRQPAGSVRPLPEHALARGPANLVRALGLGLEHDGADVVHAGASPGPCLSWVRTPPGRSLRAGARVGVAGAGGDGRQFPWRHWVAAEPSVSVYRPAARRAPRPRA